MIAKMGRFAARFTSENSEQLCEQINQGEQGDE